MAKKPIRREDFDEAAILNLIGGVDAPPRFVPKSSPAACPPETPPPELHEPPTVNPDSPAKPPVKVKGNAGNTKTEYENLFLQPRKYDARITCRLDCILRRKLMLMVQLLGVHDMTVTSLINNIISHHLEQYREEINTLIENSTKNIKL